ncbi:hypothetical protein AX774_g886 [Zancudomyces culisetae]|uniref:Uncharacterized protein n=1 Tax=Zancudomyces culisetae TaxID=1213189 RepID=A0A1R1PXC2_ZANCU|nr:hypothetical protein AX774_g5094 [Zancudomyces culisetae]OMH85548.1 hypothetical protein AX774_g886 [Zancudomyces culisetae]|eukprot:OMH81445.1 hypothetical protein AX774_g5094 [Zancudomyces culisetae]
MKHNTGIEKGESGRENEKEKRTEKNFGGFKLRIDSDTKLHSLESISPESEDKVLKKSQSKIVQDISQDARYDVGNGVKMVYGTKKTITTTITTITEYPTVVISNPRPTDSSEHGEEFPLADTSIPMGLQRFVTKHGGHVVEFMDGGSAMNTEGELAKKCRPGNNERGVDIITQRMEQSSFESEGASRKDRDGGRDKGKGESKGGSLQNRSNLPEEMKYMREMDNKRGNYSFEGEECREVVTKMESEELSIKEENMGVYKLPEMVELYEGLSTTLKLYMMAHLLKRRAPSGASKPSDAIYGY